MFTGLDGDPASIDIIQPVLQYGVSEAGGGNYWSLASWYVTTDENVFYSSSEQVNVGDNIFGNLTRVNSTAWYIGSLDTTTNQNTFVVVDDPRLESQPWAFCTLEVYSVADCAQDYPPQSSPLKFTNMVLYAAGSQVEPIWNDNNNGQDCGANITIINPSSVTVTF